MSNYAIIQSGQVINIVVWGGVPYADAIPATYDDAGNLLTKEIPAQGWQIPNGMEAVEIQDGTVCSIGYSYDGATFIAPPAPPAPVLTPDQVRAINAAQQSSLNAIATNKIAIYTDATDPDIVDTVDPKDTAALKAWKQYRVAVNKVDLTQSEPTWPQAPQS